MPQKTSAEELKALLSGKAQFALIDVREAGEYNSSHIPGSSLIPRRELEFMIADSVPNKATKIVLCDDDGRRANLAASTLTAYGYTDVSSLDGGVNRWATLRMPTEWGMNVPSKDFGEKIQVQKHVPEISATALHERIERGDKLVILDTRTPEEFNRFCIPGGRSVPGGELAYRITDITKELDDDTTVIINCAGRTRSVIGTSVLQRMGMDNIYGLENGTSGWVLAGYELESGADRIELPEPSAEGVTAAEEYTQRIAQEDGVLFLDVNGLQEVMARRDSETVYLIDVRNQGEFEAGHIPGFRWFPGGQAVQRSDEACVAHNVPIVFACDGKARASQTASFFRQIGHDEVYVLDDGTGAWTASGGSLESGTTQSPALGLNDAISNTRSITVQDLSASKNETVLFVGVSNQFAAGHVPGSHWISRSWLELNVGDIVPDKSSPITVTCTDGQNSALAADTLGSLGYANVSVLNGGISAWAKDGLPVEKGLTNVMSPPTAATPT